ncbi:hypothetical protein SDRG_13037 [Saprolegnia diclina VS20]|uniref:Uncharacterized protein n=1 Tax=Saprolegnia diclina (strain VS20) TaxID=1156394 RepID=T0PUG9_SAPDV|nr:hypothetical protein SDRG_13037 [Saprolegnia diclina VS20]EQC29164.1 hypothetical protein SDRG_13037 [Saprolegnia diclina VS20]|eukprot:XP_008617342.1 hypothetical protein SDRG_13037 [Saprolegnia diclina VS20]
MASPVLRSSDLVAAVTAYQDGLPKALMDVQRLADAVELTPCLMSFLVDATAYLANVPARFASLPYLQRYPHPSTKLPHHALFVSPCMYDRALGLHCLVVEGNVALVMRWLRFDPSLCTSATLELAAAASQGPLLRLLFTQFPTLATPKMMDLVAMSGDGPLLTWLHEAGATCTVFAMDGAAMNGHEEVVEFLHSHRTEGGSIVAATAAVVHGHARIVRYLLAERTEGIDMSLDFDVPHRHHLTHRIKGTTHLEAVDVATESAGPLTIAAFVTMVDTMGLAALEHFQARGFVQQTPHALLQLAVAKQDHAMLRHVLQCVSQEHARGPSDHDEWLPPDAPLQMRRIRHDDPRPRWGGRWVDSNVMELAAFNGDMTSLKLLHESRLRVGSDRAIVYAAYRGHLGVLDWLHTHRRDGCGKDAMALAAVAGHLDVVRWLHEVVGRCRTQAALATAAYVGDTAMVTYLLDVPTSDADDPVDEPSRTSAALPRVDGRRNASVGYVTGPAAHWAASQGHLEILELLVARGHTVPPQAIDDAVANGHIHVVRHLRERYGSSCKHRPILDAVWNCSIDTVTYVLVTRCWSLDAFASAHNDDADGIYLHMLLVTTARSGRVDLLQLVYDAFADDLRTRLPARVSERMMIRAASHGHLDMLRHLHDVLNVGWTSVVEEAALRHGRKKVPPFLRSLGPAVATVYDDDATHLWHEDADLRMTMILIDGHWRIKPL